jgi:tripartite-type tricarboxylate transporter receptor subunit TctC
MPATMRQALSSPKPRSARSNAKGRARPIDRRSLLLAGAFGLAATAARAQRLSERAIVIVVPFTPGTGIDILARLVGEELQRRWGQTVVVENKPGASGNIGTQQVARAEADGHTLLMTANTFVTNASLFRSLPYDPQTSFAPIIEVATGSLVLAVHPSFAAAASVRSLVEDAKARPDQINYSSPGRGTPQHLAMELFKQTAGISLRHVPYSGSAGAVRDLVGGHVQAMFLPLHTALPLAADKQIRLLAVGGATRSPLAPDVPTLVEQGVSGFDVDLWYGLLARAGTPAELVTRYNEAIDAILAQDAVRIALGKQGLQARGGPPGRLADLIAKDQPRWSKVVKEAGIVPECRT